MLTTGCLMNISGARIHAVRRHAHIAGSMLGLYRLDYARTWYKHEGAKIAYRQCHATLCLPAFPPESIHYQAKYNCTASSTLHRKERRQVTPTFAPPALRRIVNAARRHMLVSPAFLCMGVYAARRRTLASPAYTV
jgi:hypothetical protein